MWREPVVPHALGTWSFELRGDEIADLRYGGALVLRGVRAVVRDRDWNTAELIVDRVERTEATLTLHVRSRGSGSSFVGVVRVESRGEELVVRCDLESTTTFETNRTGLVVLHPPALAGGALAVVHSDGGVERTTFPRAISPHQPAVDIARLRWTHQGLAIDVGFEGDVFEMEDQRNWTDASFKTYSRPLALPVPVTLDAGARVVQTVTVSARPTSAAPPHGAPAALALITAGRFPAIGLGAATAPDPAPPAAASVGGAVLVELDLSWAGWPAALSRAASSGAALDVRLLLPSTDRAPQDLARTVRQAALALADLDVVRVAAFWQDGEARHVCDAEATALLRAALADADGRAPTPSILGGARSHFTQLNREHHRLAPDLDGVVFSVTPLFHTTDTAQLIESLRMQRLVATQAVVLAAGAPVHIGPVTLRPRFNDVAAHPAPPPPAPDLSGGYGAHLVTRDDERQRGDELAAWTIAAAAALAVPGVAGLTFFEEWGPRGIRAADGAEYPVAAAVRALATLSGSTLLYGGSIDGLVWVVGGLAPDGLTTLLAANLDEVAHTVTIVGGLECTVAVPAGGWVRTTG